jgi:hypothetical protein
MIAELKAKTKARESPQGEIWRKSESKARGDNMWGEKVEKF